MTTAGAGGGRRRTAPLLGEAARLEPLPFAVGVRLGPELERAQVVRYHAGLLSHSLRLDPYDSRSLALPVAMSKRLARLPALRQLLALPSMTLLYIGLTTVAALAFSLWLAHVGSWVADWTPNVATDAIGILVTVAVVDRIVERRERARVKPRVDRAMQNVGGEFRMMVRCVAWDYKRTHVGTFSPLPPTSLGVLDHWLDNVNREDTERPGVRDGAHDPFLLTNALNTATALKRSRADDRDVLEADVVAQIDEFEEGARMAFAIWGGFPEEPEERARTALEEAVRATRELGKVLVQHDEQWLEEGDALSFAVPGSWGTEFIKQEPPHPGDSSLA